MPEMTRNQWINVELTPAEPPTIERLNYPDGAPSYVLEWPGCHVAVMMTGEELQQMVSRAMVAQAAA